MEFESHILQNMEMGVHNGLYDKICKLNMSILYAIAKKLHY